MRILSIDGGGYLGLATAAFLEELEWHFNARCSDRFDLFCGTSTGAIIALGLAAGLRAKEVRELYEDFGPRVFWNPIPGLRRIRAIRGLVMARYNNRALQKSLTDVFGERTLGDIRQRGKYVVVPAFCVSSGTPRIFKTNHARDLTRDDGYLLSDVALASSAAPVFLPIVQLRSPTHGGREEYCDGGVFANHPALVGYTEALFHLQAKPSDIRLLSLSTPRGEIAEHASAKSWWDRFLLSRGLLLWSTKLSSVLIDSTSEIAHQTIKRLTSGPDGRVSIYERCAFKKPAGTGLDLASQLATTTLREIGYHQASQTENRDRMRPFFEEQYGERPKVFRGFS